MVAYPALVNPRFFSGAEKVGEVELLREYLTYVERYPTTPKTIKSHARKLLTPKYVRGGIRFHSFELVFIAA